MAESAAGPTAGPVTGLDAVTGLGTVTGLDTITGLDTVTVRGIRARGRHGVLAEERRLGQEFVVDVALHLDTRAAAASDDLADAVDYGAVADAVAAVVTGPPVDLLETLAQRVADTVLADPRVRLVDVAVHKPQAPLGVVFDDVVVRVRRGPGAPATAGGSVGPGAA